MWFFFFKEKILNYTCGLHYFYGQCCPRGRRWCSSGERQSSGLSNCSINRHALRLSVWALFFLICRKPSAADAWAYGSSLMQIEWFLVLLTIRLKSSFLGFACWLPTSCLLSGFQKFIFFLFFYFFSSVPQAPANGPPLRRTKEPCTLRCPPPAPRPEVYCYWLFIYPLYTLKKIIFWCFSGISGRNRDKDPPS